MNFDALKINLANKIEKYLKEDFENVYLSKNLANTIFIAPTQNGWRIEIPAKMYDISYWVKNKAIIYKGTGSYADKVNEQGGFSGKHKSYVERAINKALNEWFKEHNLVGRVIENE